MTQRDVSNWASTLVLNRGSQHGVAIGDCAVDSAGNLAGVITEVGLNWSRLATVLDTESQFGARVFRTGETAVAGGDLALMAEGRLRLQYLSDSANLIKGDVIVTSGWAATIPPGWSSARWSPCRRMTAGWRGTRCWRRGAAWTR